MQCIDVMCKGEREISVRWKGERARERDKRRSGRVKREMGRGRRQSERRIRREGGFEKKGRW